MGRSRVGVHGCRLGWEVERKRKGIKARSARVAALLLRTLQGEGWSKNDCTIGPWAVGL